MGRLALKKSGSKLPHSIRAARSGASALEGAAALVKAGAPALPDCASGGKTLAWFHWVEDLTLRPEPGIELPATYLYPARDGWKGSALLYFDDRGRWTDLKRQGFLANTTGFVVKETDGPAVLTVDVRGCGDTAPACLPYDIAGWAGTDRWLAYVTAALGNPLFAMRVRDGLAALEFLAVSPANAWPHDGYVPGVLMRYDLPELAGELASPVFMVNPLGADAKPLHESTINGIYPRAEHLTVRAGLSEADANAAALEFIKNCTAR